MQGFEPKLHFNLNCLMQVNCCNQTFPKDTMEFQKESIQYVKKVNFWMLVKTIFRKAFII